MNQTTDHSLWIVLVALVGATVTKPVPLEAAEKPNVVLIMADDMGYEALSVNGSESCKSPNLDKLAAQGVRFTNCFSNPCGENIQPNVNSSVFRQLRFIRCSHFGRLISHGVLVQRVLRGQCAALEK